jgi:flagellar assembly protein FliH
MAPITKFQFGTVFDVPETVPELPVYEEAPPAPVFSQEDMTRARREGFTEGKEAGIAETRSESEKQMHDILNRIAEQIAATTSGYGEVIERNRHNVVDIARTVTRKTLEKLLDAESLNAIEATIAELLPSLIEEPRIVIRVRDAALDPLQSRIDDIGARSGFPGDIILLGEPDMETALCRVEWADGGAEYDPRKFWTEIDTVIDQYLAIPTETPAEQAGISTDADNEKEAPHG